MSALSIYETGSRKLEFSFQRLESKPWNQRIFSQEAKVYRLGELKRGPRALMHWDLIQEPMGLAQGLYGLVQGR